ncbi:dynamin family protein [Desulfomicrobium sp. ZS1]|uniref:dynamin family protein n=1 Tax=Desulfomicrobium sp. ZS1 TaxID=2952228 RepID=UPI0020B1E7A5|nr:dynamin family protein [Desulfomicrobium sp. ZS1]UTF51817.1 dynamin family protein [Desulfomicrobium sp. ZS1]
MKPENTPNPSAFQIKLQELLSSLQVYESMADEGLMVELKKNAQSIAASYTDIMTANRSLKLGIVGRVKAGKSSFLNALIFDGRNVLPKAATPMTAALTRIAYAPSAEAQQAFVYYYSREEWTRIEESSRRYDEKLRKGVQIGLEALNNSPRRKGAPPSSEDIASIKRDVADHMPEDLKVCHELVQMAKNTIQHADLPRAKEQEDWYCVASGTDSAKTFIESLAEYVGADGLYTPMVKYIELQVYDKGLEGLEVVDTPGLNDPVASRVDVTNRFLKECDAVLVLSGVSHFLDAQDSDLISKQLHNAGVARAYIIGTMMDVGIMECPRRDLNLQTAYKESKLNYLRQAKTVLSSLEKIQPLPGRLSTNSRPEFVSSIMFGISRKLQQREDLHSEEAFVLERLDKLFPGYQKQLATAEDFASFAGFDGVHTNIYMPVFEEKEKIVQERIAQFQSVQAGVMCTMLEDICIDATNRKSILKKNDIMTLSEKLSAIQENLQSSKIEVRAIFDEISINSQRIINDLKLNVRQVMSGFKRIKVESEVKTREYTTGFIFKDYHHEVETIHKASVNDAADNIENYVVEAMRLITAAFSDMLNIKSIEMKLRNAIYDTFTSADSDSSKADIIGPVQILVNTLTIPEIDFSCAEEAKRNIFNKFSSQVCDSQIEDLKVEQNEQLQHVYANMANNLDDALAKLKSTLGSHGANFIDNVSGKIRQSYETMEKQLKDKDKNLQMYKDFIDNMTAIKKDFAEFGM